MFDAREIVSLVFEEAERIEREKHGKALTPDEVRAIRAAEFLRKILPAKETTT